MDVWCEICGRRWDQLDPGVRYIYGDGRWECRDEEQCFMRRAIEAASVPLHAVPEAGQP